MILCDFIKKYNKPLLAFSGGSDSTYLLYKMKENCKDFTAASLLMPNSVTRDLKNIYNIEEILGVKVLKRDFNPLDIKEFRENSKLRCFYCKTHVCSVLKEIARKENCDAIFDGTNVDDLKVYRPGLKAKEDGGVISPLALCGINKEKVLKELKKLGLPYKPSDSCYATRIAYNEEITLEKLETVKFCENFILDLGISRVRCRLNEGNITIDVPKAEGALVFEKRDLLTDTFRKRGIKTISLDLEGLVSGKQDR